MSNIESLQVSSEGSNETQRFGSIVRSVGAVLAGVLAVFVLSLGTDVVLHATGIYPPWFQPMSDGFFVLALAYRLVYGILGGYLTARLALIGPCGMSSPSASWVSP